MKLTAERVTRLLVVPQIDEVDSIHLATERLMGSMGDTPEMVRQARILALVGEHSSISLFCISKAA